MPWPLAQGDFTIESTMNYTFHTDNLKLSALDQEFLDKKLSRLEKHLWPPYTLTINLRRNNHHRTGDVIECQMNVHLPGIKHPLHAERSAATIQDCLDQTLHALANELQREHDKAKEKDNHSHSGG